MVLSHDITNIPKFVLEDVPLAMPPHLQSKCWEKQIEPSWDSLLTMGLLQVDVLKQRDDACWQLTNRLHERTLNWAGAKKAAQKVRNKGLEVTGHGTWFHCPTTLLRSHISNLYRCGKKWRTAIMIPSYGVMRYASLRIARLGLDLARCQTEGLLLLLDHDRRRVRPYMRAANILTKLNVDGQDPELDRSAHRAAEFDPEASSFTLESMPRKPWDLSSRDLLNVETNMKSR